MPAAPSLSSDSRTTAGISLRTILAVEYGGLTVLRIARGRQPATEFQKAFARAGHAHASVFAVFALLIRVLADCAHLHGPRLPHLAPLSDSREASCPVPAPA